MLRRCWTIGGASRGFMGGDCRLIMISSRGRFFVRRCWTIGGPRGFMGGDCWLVMISSRGRFMMRRCCSLVYSSYIKNTFLYQLSALI